MNIPKELENILNTFTSKIVDINNYQSFVKNSTKHSLEFYENQIHLSKNSNIDSIGDFNSISSWDIRDDSHIQLGKSENTLQDLIEVTQLQNNRQYQGLLVDAYESFLKYTDELYAYLSYRDNTFWSQKISNETLDEKSFDWFLQTLQKSNNRRNIIDSTLKEKLPILKLLEKSNPRGIDYDFKIRVIKELRHVIVHNRGNIEDIDTLIKSIIPNISTYKKEIQENLKQEVLWYIGGVNSYNFILLLEFYHKDNKLIFRRYTDRLGDLLSVLSAYAILLKNLSEWYLSDNEILNNLVASEEAYRKFFSSSNLYGYLK